VFQTIASLFSGAGDVAKILIALATGNSVAATNAFDALLGKPKGVGGGEWGAELLALPGKFIADAVKFLISPVTNFANANTQAPSGGPGPAGVGGTAGEIANGTQIYQYLLKNLFGGNRIAAAGATASIWGESTWNPFAVGGGGRGLIGWSPPSTISNADFSGGMRTQLPAILRFVTQSGDSGVIAQMFQAGSVLQAANEWGHGVERFGINDVHPTGLQLAKRIAGLKEGGLVADRGAVLRPGLNLLHNKTGRHEPLVPPGTGSVTVIVQVPVGAVMDNPRRTGKVLADLIKPYLQGGGTLQASGARR
jgi:hypothetical protein